MLHGSSLNFVWMERKNGNFGQNGQLLLLYVCAFFISVHCAPYFMIYEFLLPHNQKSSFPFFPHSFRPRKVKLLFAIRKLCISEVYESFARFHSNSDIWNEILALEFSWFSLLCASVCGHRSVHEALPLIQFMMILKLLCAYNNKDHFFFCLLCNIESVLPVICNNWTVVNKAAFATVVLHSPIVIHGVPWAPKFIL